MKKFGLLALVAVLLLGACNRNEEEVAQPTQPTTSVDAMHFYGVKRSENAGGTMERQGVAQRTNLWYPCSAITVKFLNDPYNMKEMVKATAKQWEQYAGITFNFVESGDAFVRIGFDWNDDRFITWSYIGTDCKRNTDQNDATVSFAYWDSSTEQERKADVLRVFGQVLGLELEHRHLTFSPGWTSRISQYWTGEMSDLTWETLKKYVFDPLDAANLVQTAEYDANSIMVWPFSSRYAANTAREFNYELSAQDIAFIGQLYPKNACDDGAIVTMKTSKQDVRVTLATNSDIVIDWGDGVRENRAASTTVWVLTHSYTGAVDHTIKIYGNIDALVQFDCNSNQLIMLDVSRNVKLSSLICNVNKLTSMDVSKNTLLTYFDCSYNQITALDVSKNVLLNQFDCHMCQLTQLDVSNNLQLITIYCSNNNLATLDVSRNVQLHMLGCLGNQLTTLDLSKNTALVQLMCNDNKLSALDVSKNVQLKVLWCYDNQLVGLSASNNMQLEHLSCYNNPFVTDQIAIIDLAQSLPNRSASGLNSKLRLSNATSASWIASICAAKNWTIY